MKVSAFKRMIMEAAREGVILGLQDIFDSVPEQKIVKEVVKPIGPSAEEIKRNLARKMSAAFGGQSTLLEEVEQPMPVAGENPYMAFLLDTAKNITAEDRQGIGNLGNVI